MPIEMSPNGSTRWSTRPSTASPRSSRGSWTTSSSSSRTSRRTGEPDDLLGLYDGVALTERDSTVTMQLPDRIFVFRGPLLDMCETEEQLVEEVRITVVHEIAHHFGIDDDRLHELGYA